MNLHKQVRILVRQPCYQAQMNLNRPAVALPRVQPASNAKHRTKRRTTRIGQNMVATRAGSC